MSGVVSSLKSKLSRLTSAGPGSVPMAPPPQVAAPIEPTPGEMPIAVTLPVTPAPRLTVLEELRAKMEAMLARSGSLAVRTPPPVATAELPFFTEDTPLGVRHRRVLRLPPSHTTGRFAVQPGRDADASLLALLALDPDLAACDPKRALYLDTETTGLAGGTGTVAFLVGLGAFEEDGTFAVEQLLVRNLGEEGPMLLRVAERIREASMLVTFNGKSFDMPLLRTRFVLARQGVEREPPHLDLVHVARRIHKARGGAYKLTRLERDVLGFEREGDVPSGDVSACYLHFLRSGDAGSLIGVVDHNAWDVVTMAALVGLYGEPLDATQLEADDLAGVAYTLKRAGKLEHAFDVAEQAVRRAGDGGQPGHAPLEARARLAKARGDRARALADFERLAERVDSPAVRLELAKLYEHFLRAPDRALAVLAGGTNEKEPAAMKRVERLTKKARGERRATKAAVDVPEQRKLVD